MIGIMSGLVDRLNEVFMTSKKCESFLSRALMFGHAKFRRTWASMSFQKTMQELFDMGYEEHYECSTSPPNDIKLLCTPSSVSSYYSSSVDTVIMNFEEEECVNYTSSIYVN